MAEATEAQAFRTVVLLVEDDPTMRELLRAYLQCEGFVVVDEPSAERAVIASETVPLAAAVVDKELPGMGGLDLLSLLKERHTHLPVIVVTAFGGPAVAEEALARGASRYLEKPFRLRELAAALRMLTLCAAANEPTPGDA
jgi:DNA-binding response OmpR family regulator